MQNRDFNINIPPRFFEEKIINEGMGNIGILGYKNGDFIIEVNDLKHDKFLQYMYL